MAFISRLLPFNSNYFKFIKAGVSPTASKLILATANSEPYLRFGILRKSSDLKLFENSFNNYSNNSNVKKIINEITTSGDKKHSKVGKPTTGGKLANINLRLIVDNSENLPQGLLIATFNKMCTVYHARKSDPVFQRELHFFTISKVFQNFCEVIHKALPNLSPLNLTSLLNLVYFNVSPQSTLMQKIFALILDNLHLLPVCDLMEIYCELKENFQDVKECKAILEACDVYFDVYFEEEISHCEYLQDIVYFISESQLPLNVRKLITEKFLTVIEKKSCTLNTVHKFFIQAFKPPISTIYTSELLEKLRFIITCHDTLFVQKVFSKIYRRALKDQPMLYNQQLCEKFVSNISSTFKFFEPKCFMVLNNICYMGHFSQNLLDIVSNFILNSDIDSVPPNNVLAFASVFARASFHEMNNPNWTKIKKSLESYNALVKFGNSLELLEWCEYLTFLGCDTHDLLTNILMYINKLAVSTPNRRYILRFYHFSKAYFPHIELHRKLLDSYLQDSAHEKSFYLSSCLEEFFGSEDYVLLNCRTTDLHFLPLIAVLGPDNKPINLSTYKPMAANSFIHKDFRVMNNIDYIEKPPGSKVLAFLDYIDPQPFEYRNEPITSGHLRMFLKSYEGVNYNFIPLNESFFNLTSDKKIAYLDSEVKKITQNCEIKK